MERNVTAFADYDDVEIRAGVVDSLVETLSDEKRELPELIELQTLVEQVCKKLTEMIEFAERNAIRNSMQKFVRQQVETFMKRFPNAASRGDVKKSLLDMKHGIFGRGEDAEQTRRNIDLLQEQLEEEVPQNSDHVVIENWRTRFQRFKNQPWAKVPNWGGHRCITSAAVLGNRANRRGSRRESTRRERSSGY